MWGKRGVGHKSRMIEDQIKKDLGLGDFKDKGVAKNSNGGGKACII